MASVDELSGGKLNRLKAQWQKGKCTLGAIATMPSVQTVQVMARSGLDWIIIDMEHGPIDLAAAHAMIVATSETPLVPLVRVAAGAPWQAKANAHRAEVKGSIVEFEFHQAVVRFGTCG